MQYAGSSVIKIIASYIYSHSCRHTPGIHAPSYLGFEHLAHRPGLYERHADHEDELERARMDGRLNKGHDISPPIE